MSLADKVDGRIIHQSLDLTLFPPDTTNAGHTDAAIEVGARLLSEIHEMIRKHCEAAGFRVELEASWVIY